MRRGLSLKDDLGRSGNRLLPTDREEIRGIFVLNVLTCSGEAIQIDMVYRVRAPEGPGVLPTHSTRRKVNHVCGVVPEARGPARRWRRIELALRRHLNNSQSKTHGGLTARISKFGHKSSCQVDGMPLLCFDLQQLLRISL